MASYARPYDQEAPLLGSTKLVDGSSGFGKQHHPQQQEHSGCCSSPFFNQDYFLIREYPAEYLWRSSLGPRGHLGFRLVSLCFALYLAVAGFLESYTKHPEQWILQFPNWAQALTLLYLGAAVLTSLQRTWFSGSSNAEGSHPHYPQNAALPKAGEWWVWRLQIVTFQLAFVWSILIALLFLTVPHRFKVFPDKFFHWVTPLAPAVIMLFEAAFGYQRFVKRHFWFQLVVVTAYFGTTAAYAFGSDKWAYSYLKWDTWSPLWLYVASIGVTMAAWAAMMGLLALRDDWRLGADLDRTLSR